MRRSGEEGGFSLLEVLCAFLILALLTGQLTRNFVNNVQKATTALTYRELREAADTIFRKMIYEWQEYRDGDERTLDEEYGKFADLKGWQRDRWAVYRCRLEKKPRTVVGTPPEGGDTLFEDDGQDDAPAPSAGGEAEAAAPGQELVEMVLRIWSTEEESDQPLLVLRTWIDPERGQVNK